MATYETPPNSAPATTAIPELPPDATPEQRDAHWFKHVYQGDRMPQLTVRAVLMGGVLGMLMSAANLYTTLAIGWAFGIAITACVLSFVVWNTVRLLAPKGVSQMSILENACMASCASAAGYSTGSTIATMFGALVLLKDPPPGLSPDQYAKWAQQLSTADVSPWWLVGLFTLCTGLMGVFLAIPMKRQQINHEQLPFPSGTAAAETLRSLYSQSVEAVHKAYVLVLGLGAGLLLGFFRAPDDVVDKVGFLKKFFSFVPRIPAEIKLNWVNHLYPGGRHPAGFAFEPSALLVAAGMIVGMRTSVSMVVGSIILYAGVAPYVAKLDAAVFEKPAILMMSSAQSAAQGITDPAAALDAAVAAVEKSATELGLDAAEFKAAALGAANNAKEGLTPGQPLDSAAISALAKGVGVAVADRAAKATANLPATKAKAEAMALAKAAGKSEADIAQEGAKAFDAKKYRPNFNWVWGADLLVIARWALWGGTSLMVFSSLMSVALQWKTIVRAFMGAKSGTTAAEADQSAKMRAIEVPASWMIIGMLPITIAMVWLQMQAFGVSLFAGIVAVAMSFVLSLVASRATGETDTTPIGAMGKVMQLLFAALAPKNIAANLAAAGIAANSASSCADLLTDLKTGYLLGANPRRQFLAQFFGVFFGTIAVVPIWYLMVPTRAKLETFAAPATRAWEAVARVLVNGVSELPPSAIMAIFIGAGLGCILPVVERLLPANLRKYMPSATGLGLSWVIPFQNAFSFFIGAVIALIWLKLGRKSQEKFNIPLASGLVAGESLMAAALAIIATIVGLLVSK